MNERKMMKQHFFICFIVAVIVFFMATTTYGINADNAIVSYEVIAAGESSSFAIQSDGSLWAWGRESFLDW
jgi:hypothetical protein